MKKSISVILFFLALVLGACQALPPAVSQTEVEVAPALVETVAPIPEANVESTEEPDVAPIIAPVTIRYAKNFTLEYREGYKLLSVKTPDSTMPVRYVLVPKGTSPEVAEQDAVVVQTPIEKIITLSSTYYPMLDQIDKLDNVVGIDDGTYTFNETIRSKVEKGVIAVVGGDGFSAKLNLEKVIEISPDILMAPYLNAQVLEEAKLNEARQTLVLNADYLENSPLGRAEWGKFIAAFFEMEEEASQVFDQMVARYEEVKSLVEEVEQKPSVFVNTAYQGSWYMPGKESYVAELLRDAGANYLFAENVEGTGASPLAFEIVYEKAKEADYWLNIGFASDLASLVSEDARYSEFMAVKEGKVYNNNARVNPNGGTDFYEGGVANPDLVLRDLVKIFYPELLPDHQLFYYTRVN